MEIRKLNVAEIIQSENMRDMKDVSELMRSIEQHGLLQPIGVRQILGDWECVYGNRRLTAVKKLGWKTIDAIEVVTETSDDFLTKNLVENLQRSEPSIAEYGRVFLKLKALGLSEKEISARVSLPISKVETIVEAVRNVDERLLKKISFKKTPKGAGIGVQGLLAANRIVRWGGKEKTEELVKAVVEGRISPVSADLAQRIMQSTGMTETESMAAAEECVFRSLPIVIGKADTAKLEKQFGMAISRILIEHLAQTFPIVLDGKVQGPRRIMRKKI